MVAARLAALAALDGSRCRDQSLAPPLGVAEVIAYHVAVDVPSRWSTREGDSVL